MSQPVMPRCNGIPALGLGTYPLVGDQLVDTIHMALDLGYTHIDTAQMYGNEADVGRALKNANDSRQTLFITTKVDPSNLNQKRFADSVKRSIDELGGPADLLLIHWPPADSEMDATLDRLAAEQAKGMARLIGVSNFSSKMLRHAKARLPQIICNQVEFQPLLDQTKLKLTADALNLPLVAYSPIARGAALKHPSIVNIAMRHNRPPSEITLRWIVQQGVVAIPMTTKRDNAASNLRIFDFELTPDDMAAISAIGTKQGRTINPGMMAGRWDD